MITIKNQFLEAEVTPWRAELVGLRDIQGRDFLWKSDPQVWKGSSPILFPIVGRVPDDKVLIDGKSYELGQHGFAPASTFEVLNAGSDECVLRLASTDETRLKYPFEFTLDIGYRLEAFTLKMSATVTNLSSNPMPFSFGFHPGFRWPLPGGGAREGHVVSFEADETIPMRRPLHGLLDPADYPSPIVERQITLSDSLFEQGAMMFFGLRSRALRFGSTTGPALDITWTNLPDLALWSQPGAGYLCVEPWQGYSALPDFHGDLSQKPGTVVLPPSESREFGMSVTVTDERAGDV